MTAMDLARAAYARACERALSRVVRDGAVEHRNGELVLVVPLSRLLSDTLAALGCEFEDLETEGAAP